MLPKKSSPTNRCSFQLSLGDFEWLTSDPRTTFEMSWNTIWDHAGSKYLQPGSTFWENHKHGGSCRYSYSVRDSLTHVMSQNDVSFSFIDNGFPKESKVCTMGASHFSQNILLQFGNSNFFTFPECGKERERDTSQEGRIKQNGINQIQEKVFGCEAKKKNIILIPWDYTVLWHTEEKKMIFFLKIS